MCRKLLSLFPFVFVVIALALPAYAGDPGVMMYKWNGFAGVNVADLTAHADYPDNPHETQILTEFSTAIEFDDNYGTRIFGYVVPTVSDTYTFYLTTDDAGQLWLSTDDNPANTSMIVEITGWAGPDDWANTSAPVYLEAGTKYYIETLQKEEGGGDHVRVAWSTATMARTIIPGANLETMPIPSARYPSPADKARLVDLNADLGWTPGDGTTSQDLYFGTTNPPPYVGSVGAAATSFDPGTMPYGTRYYWQIVGSEASSPVWTFQTLPDPALLVDPNLLGWWKWDGDYLDSSGYNNHGTPFGATGFANDSQFGQVLTLPGGSNQYVNIGMVGISGTMRRTIACWAKADNTAIPDWTLIFGFTSTPGVDGSHFNIGSLGGPGGVGAHCWGWEETIFSDEEALEWH
ncbi:MAG: hypothetical protein JW720_08085, partial [Sedimentisphaerales bacterium]|nr:hypothetical protein [Sedimentisphaerales bacterium]